jgi:methionine sulfoxide reductase catalytic subunit
MNRNTIRPSEITPEHVFLNRRALVAGAIAMGLLPDARRAAAAVLPRGGEFSDLKPWPQSTDERQSPWGVFSTYNNFYEFGTGKSEPARYADTLVTDPWSIEVTGEADRTGSYTLEDILKPHTLEERVYRHRCVEHWSIVVPWAGFPLGDLLKRFEPNSNAKYVEFFSLADPKQMPGLKSDVLDWPYREGLRIDEAMHPLTLAAVGAYGRVLPNQSGAPIRLVVPWKYGFKSIKSIVRIHFTAEKPRIGTESARSGGWTWTTSWNQAWDQAYGFYSNVNPHRPHPGWTQAVERRLDGAILSPSIETQLFNGYAEEVADLYRGMNLIANY